jgi:hypothetical protein
MARVQRENPIPKRLMDLIAEAQGVSGPETHQLDG